MREGKGRGVRGAATVDDHMHSTGWDMMEMGMKQNMRMRMMNHAHSVCMILHVHEGGSGCCLRGGGVNIVYKDISLRAP